MPYIPQLDRAKYDIYEMMPPENGGDLNYVISRLIDRYTEFHGLRYAVITEVRGALIGSLHEYNIWVADPYEKRKREENGCVWWSLEKRE